MEKTAENRYTVVVSSCDNYNDLWDPFFKILKAEWPELIEKQIPIVLNTESRSYRYEDLNLRTMQLYQEGDNPPWTERLRKTLEMIETDYIIFLLDDFFMKGRVRSAEIDRHMKWMDENPRISSFCYKETFVSKNIQDGKYEGYERRPLFSHYKYNCQAALWRRERLISYLKKNENPWEWEWLGNWRSYRHPMHFFYSVKPDGMHVFPYLDVINGHVYGGAGVFRGRWCLESVENVFLKHGVIVDYSIRGVVSPEELVPSQRLEEPVKKREDAPFWKQAMWFARPVYVGIKNTYSKTRYVLQHIDHFFDDNKKNNSAN